MIVNQKASCVASVYEIERKVSRNHESLWSNIITLLCDLGIEELSRDFCLEEF